MLKNSAISPTASSEKRPAHQSVYELVRNQVLFGELAPGQSVTIQGLTEEIGAGMTPVREAIRRLTSDGALKMLGNRRVIVPLMTAEDVEQLEFMRETLEPELTKRATKLICEADISALKQQDDALNKAIENGDIKAYLMHNYQFHATLYAAARAPIVHATVDRLWLRFGPSLRVVCGRYGTLNLPDKHADLLEAIDRRDVDAAAKAIKEDVHQGMMQITDALETQVEAQ